MENPKEKNKASSRAGLVIIGNEILSGRTQDTNTPWIAEKLTAHGVPLAEVRVVPDIPAKIIEAVNALRHEYDYVFTTGGIGPTHDDITAECVAQAFVVPYEDNPEAYAALEAHYGKEDLTPARSKMAKMPAGARMIPNPVSGAPGFIIGNVHVMAGIPRIMQAMFNHVLETIEPGAPILANTVGCDLPESQVAEGLEEIQAAYPAVEIGSYPHYRGGIAGVSLVLRSTDAASVKAATEKVMKLVEDRGGTPLTLGFQVDVDD